MVESFDEWVREAEETLLVPGDYPIIDSSEIDMADELRTLAYRVVREEVEGSSITGGQVEPTVEFLELRLIRADGALPVRFVILNFLYRLAHFQGFVSAESAPLLHREVWPHFETFVGLPDLDPGALRDPRAVQWEITNACVAYKWGLAAALFDRLKFLGAITSVHFRALKGQMYVCSVVAPRDEDESGESQGHLARWWLPQLDTVFFPGDDIFRSIRPITLLGWGMNLADRVEYSAEERARLSYAAHEWEEAFQKDSDLLSSYRAAWAKCYFISGNYVKAAEQFERLLALGLGFPWLSSEAEARMRSQLYQNAAECYAKGDVVEKAKLLLERCAEEFPGTRGLWLKLARLHLSSPLDVDTGRVLDCLRKEEEIDPSSFGEDPRGSIALMLAEVAGNDLPATLRKVAETSPGDLQFMTSVVSRHWPSFLSLDEKSRTEWVGAALLLWGSSTCPWNRPLLRRKVAGAIADIAEEHLRRLFDRFRQEKGNVVLEKMPPGSSVDKFLKYLKGSRLTLGEMIFEIDDTRRFEPQYPDLKAWLHWNSKRVGRLNDLRRTASHGGSDLSEEDAIELYDLSVWFVDLLYG
ncbi:MAG TPA: hypothetical protein VN924_30710 [Bryobacteraceae bacterium]|nr:hypothetical protein [Bryobacteraceae bacterium]